MPGARSALDCVQPCCRFLKAALLPLSQGSPAAVEVPKAAHRHSAAARLGAHRYEDRPETPAPAGLARQSGSRAAAVQSAARRHRWPSHVCLTWRTCRLRFGVN